MKKYLIAVLYFYSFYPSYAQNLKSFSAQAIIGTKLHTDNFEGPPIDDAWQLKSSLLLGVEITYRKWPQWSFSYLHDRTHFLYNKERPYPLLNYHDSNLFSSLKGNFWGLYYRKKHFKYGLGYYKSLHEDAVNYIFPGVVFLKQHVALSFSFVSGNAEFEFVKLFQYKKLFSVFGIDNQYFTVKYRLFGKKEGFPRVKTKENAKTSLIFKTGMRGFLVKNTLFPGEQKDRFGTSFLAGIEFKFKKINTSLFVERDWWLRLNGGSPYREIKGYVVNSVFGLKYSLPKLKGTYVSFGYDWTTDYNTINETWEKISAGEEKVDLFYYNIKGLAVGVGFPISRKFDIDLRGILPLRGEKGFNPMRYSLGVAYKIYP